MICWAPLLWHSLMMWALYILSLKLKLASTTQKSTFSHLSNTSWHIHPCSPPLWHQRKPSKKLKTPAISWEASKRMWIGWSNKRKDKVTFFQKKYNSRPMTQKDNLIGRPKSTKKQQKTYSTKPSSSERKSQKSWYSQNHLCSNLPNQWAPFKPLLSKGEMNLLRKHPDPKGEAKANREPRLWRRANSLEKSKSWWGSLSRELSIITKPKNSFLEKPTNLSTTSLSSDTHLLVEAAWPSRRPRRRLQAREWCRMRRWRVCLCLEYPKPRSHVAKRWEGNWPQWTFSEYRMFQFDSDS